MLAVYIFSVVLSALLLFLVQPMAAKMLLPALGGSPSVWNTCMVFFQVLLLAGYLYAHLLTRKVRPAWQLAVHLVVLALPLAVLPLGAGRTAELTAGASPVLLLLGWLAVWVGPPFFVLATSAPLLQRWFAATDHADAADPYFLYAASNFGSITALAGYPFVLEPALSVARQSLVWSAGYVLLAVAVLASGGLMLARRNAHVAQDPPVAAHLSGEVSGRTRLLWVLLALVPSSAMLGATQFITTDIASVPLLWVVPLALYLLTFIFSFARRHVVPPSWWNVGLAVGVAIVVGLMFSRLDVSKWISIPLHAATLFLVGMVCHGRLASLRPSAGRLTEFYIWIALGGALGGTFNALVAPVVFDSVLEYPIALVAACLLRPAVRRKVELLDLAMPAGLAVLLVGLDLGFWPALASIAQGVVPVGRFALPVVLCSLVMFRRLRFGLALAAVVAAGVAVHQLHTSVIHTQRTFFGVHEVLAHQRSFDAVGPDGQQVVIPVTVHQLFHGATRHGSQLRAEPLAAVPTSYYHPSGPLGQVFEVVLRKRPRLRVGAIGLGAGTLAAYGQPDIRMTFYEIDAEVVRIARDAQLFSYVQDSASPIEFVVGDGRTMLAHDTGDAFDLIVVDAFNSGSIPVHLITREAIELYFEKLRPRGVLALHMTSRYLDLIPVVDAIAADLALVAFSRRDGVSGVQQEVEGKDSSEWAVLARRAGAVGAIAQDPRWRRLTGAAVRPMHLWTDDFSNILGVIDHP